MKQCPDCQIKIVTNTTKCPLCHNQIGSENIVEQYSYPKFDFKESRRRLFLKIVAVISLVGIFVTGLVNWLTFSGHLWSIVAIAAILYVWLVFISLDMKKNVHISVKLMTHAISITGLLLIIEAFVTSPKIITSLKWNLAFAMPSIFIGFILIIGILMLVKKQQQRDYIIALLSLSMLGFIPLILVFFQLVNPIYMSIAAAGVSFMVIVALFILGRRIVISELGRKFHI